MPKTVICLDVLGTRGALITAVARTAADGTVSPTYFNYGGVPPRLYSLKREARLIRDEGKGNVVRHYPAATKFLPPFYPRQGLREEDLQQADFILVPDPSLVRMFKGSYSGETLGRMRLMLPTLGMERKVARGTLANPTIQGTSRFYPRYLDDAFFPIEAAIDGWRTCAPPEENIPQKRIGPSGKFPTDSGLRFHPLVELEGLEYLPRDHASDDVEGSNLVAIGMAVKQLANGEVQAGNGTITEEDSRFAT